MAHQYAVVFRSVESCVLVLRSCVCVIVVVCCVAALSHNGVTVLSPLFIAPERKGMYDIFSFLQIGI